MFFFIVDSLSVTIVLQLSIKSWDFVQNILLDAQLIAKSRDLISVFSERVRYMLSPVRLSSVCLSSVCLSVVCL